MQMIGANCRDQFRGDDFDFIAATLASAPVRQASLTELLTDPAARDAALESDRLFSALIDAPDPLPVSPQLYFYVLTRHGLGQFERDVSDYIANVLTAFLDLQRLRTLPCHPEQQTDYLVDMLAVLSELQGPAAFATRAHVGNYSLFMAGIFADHLRYREWVRGAPGLSYYEQVGSANYCLASDQREARQAGLDEILRTIGESFGAVRTGLNSVADRFLHLEHDESFGA